MGASRIDPGGIAHRCTSQVQQSRIDSIKSFDSDILVLMGRYPLAMTGRWFDNGEGGVEHTQSLSITDGNSTGVEVVPQAITRAMLAILETQSDIIIVYPFPEAGWHVPKTLLRNQSENNKNKMYPLSTSYAAFLERTASTFKLFDSFEDKRIHRVYPHQLFCNTLLEGRCITHDANQIFYADSHHPSFAATALIAQLIEEKIEEISELRKD